MAIKKRMCVHHPERAAIGVCVITKQPICAECSTRYEGVNYSKEGLRILQEQRATAAGRARQGHRAALALSVLCSPVLLYMLYLFYRWTFLFLIDFQQFDFQQFFEGG